MKSEAWFLVRHGSAQQAFERRALQLPALKEGQVLIETEAFGLNFADVMARRGLYAAAPPVPSILGYEVAGKIAETCGETPFKKGDRVVAFTRFGGYASHCITDYRAAAAIPDQMDAAEATALATQYATAYYAADIAVRLHEGEHVLIQAAAGGVGTALVQLAKHKGCVVYGTAGSDEKLKYLESIGVDFPINYRKDDFAEKVRALQKGKGIDVVFDNLGGKSFRKGFRLLREGGRIVGYGAADRLGGGLFSGLRLALGFGWYHAIPLLVKSKVMAGVNMLAIADNKPELLQKLMREVMDHYHQGIFKPKIGHTFNTSDLPEAHHLLESRNSIGKIALYWK